MKITFFLYILTFLFISCADIEKYSESCDDANCSQNATCNIIGRVIKCECKDGYIGNGISCVTATKSWTKVIGNTNAEDSSAIVSDSKDNVYVAGSFDGIVDLDPSLGEDSYSAYICKEVMCEHTCGENSICNDNVCECKEGYELVSGSCVKVVCTTRCSFSQYCEDNQCFCKIGFSETLDGCTENRCELSCSEGEYCEDGVCNCRDNYLEVENNSNFISKFSPDGKYLWTKIIGGKISNIKVDKDDNLYILGSFKGKVDFNSGSREDIHSSETKITFITKITSSGSYIGTVTLNAKGEDILIDNEYFYIVGSFKGETEFGSNKNFLGELEGASQTFTSTNYTDIFFSKFLINGKYLWTKVLIGNGANNCKSISMDSNKNIFIAGDFNNTLDFDPTDKEDIHTANNQADMFITKFNPAGNYLWTKTIGAARNDRIDKIKIDQNNDIIIAGTLEDTIIFNEKTYSTNSSNDIIVAKLKNNGDDIWVKLIGGEETEVFNDMDIDSEGNIYIAGDFTPGKNNFPNGLEIEGDSDAFIGKISNDGKILWGRTISSSEDWEYLEAVAIDSKDNILLTGDFTGELTLFSDNNDYSTGLDDADDYFIIKLIQD